MFYFGDEVIVLRGPHSLTLAEAKFSFYPAEIYSEYTGKLPNSHLFLIPVWHQLRLNESIIFCAHINFFYEGNRVVIFVTLNQTAENGISDHLCFQNFWWITTRPHSI